MLVLLVCCVNGMGEFLERAGWSHLFLGKIEIAKHHFRHPQAGARWFSA